MAAGERLRAAAGVAAAAHGGAHGHLDHLLSLLHVAHAHLLLRLHDLGHGVAHLDRLLALLHLAHARLPPTAHEQKSLKRTHAAIKRNSLNENLETDLVLKRDLLLDGVEYRHGALLRRVLGGQL